MAAVRCASRSHRVLVAVLLGAALASGPGPASPARALPGQVEPAPEDGTEEAPQQEAGDEGTDDEGTDDEAPELDLPKKLSAWVPPEERARVEIEIACDAPCVVLLDGEEAGTLEAGARDTFEVPVGDQRIKARSVDYRAAEWDKVVKVRESRNRTVEVRMAKAIADLHRYEQRRAVYRDEKRSLAWTRRDNGADVRWEAAVAYCEALQLGGWEDWRLPTLGELETLRSLWSQASLKIVGQITLTACCPWSADPEGDERAWNYNFRHRRPFVGHRSYSLDQRALCVRPLDEPADTGDAEEPAAGEGFPDSSPSHW